MIMNTKNHRPTQVISVLLLWIVITSVISAADEPRECGTRMRKSWYKLNRFERQLYLEAVDLSMQSGDHLLFAQVHIDPLTEVEAHATCGFTLWHRKFLLAYENMLRRQAPTKFRCLTLPYWDVFADAARMSNHECTTLEGCSRVLRDFGGSQGPYQSVDLGVGEPMNGSCVSHSPLSNFCFNSNPTLNDSNCAPGCVPRGNWSQTHFPSGFGIGSLAKVISEAKDYETFTTRIQMGIHNSLHNAAGGALGTFWSPVDPVFYLLHTTVDMLHHLYYECHVGRAMSREEKRTSPLAFQSCARNTTVRNPGADSTIYMQHSIPTRTSSTRQDVHRHPRLGTFFRSLGTRYYHWVDTLDIRTRSYGYHFAPLARALMDNDLICPRPPRVPDEQRALFASSMSPDVSRPVQQMLRWFDAASDAVRPLVSSRCSNEEILDQLELMECQYHAQHFGGVDDYSTAFRYAMNMSSSTMHTRCWIVLEQLRANTSSILLPDYEALFETHFDHPRTRCAIKKHESQNVPSRQVQHYVERTIST